MEGGVGSTFALKAVSDSESGLPSTACQSIGLPRLLNCSESAMTPCGDGLIADACLWTVSRRVGWKLTEPR